MKKVKIYSIELEKGNTESIRSFVDFENAAIFCDENEISKEDINTETISKEEAFELWENGYLEDADETPPIFEEVEEPEEQEEQENTEEAETTPTIQNKPLEKMTKTELLGQLQNLAVQVAELQKNSAKPQKLSFEELKKQYEEKSKLLALRDFLKNTLTNIKSVMFRPKTDNPFEIEGYSLIYARNNEQILKVQNSLVLERFRSFILNELENSIKEVDSKI